jgi:hypothetical protein
MIVHVVAWEYEGGGGFDWYYEEEKADEAFEKEQFNVKELVGSNWTAFRFNVDVGDLTDQDQITALIDGQLIELCDQHRQSQ